MSHTKEQILTMFTSFTQENREDYARQIYEIAEAHFTTPAAPSPGGLGDEDKVIICLNCKAFHFFGTWVCDRCGGKTFSAAHPSNKQFIEPVSGGMELAKEWAKENAKFVPDDQSAMMLEKSFLAGYASKGDGVEAIEFAEWIRDNVSWQVSEWVYKKRPYTTAELFQLFQTTKSK